MVTGEGVITGLVTVPRKKRGPIPFFPAMI